MTWRISSLLSCLMLFLLSSLPSSNTFKDIFFFSSIGVSSIDLPLSLKVSCSPLDTNVLSESDFRSSRHPALKFLATKMLINHSKLETQSYRKCQSHTPIMEAFMKFACVCLLGTHRVQVSPSQNHTPLHSIRCGMNNLFALPTAVGVLSADLLWAWGAFSVTSH